MSEHNVKINGTQEGDTYLINDTHVLYTKKSGKFINIPVEDINRIANVLTHLWNIKESEKRIAEISNPPSNEPPFE